MAAILVTCADRLLTPAPVLLRSPCGERRVCTSSSVAQRLLPQRCKERTAHSSMHRSHGRQGRGNDIRHISLPEVHCARVLTDTACLCMCVVLRALLLAAHGSAADGGPETETGCKQRETVGESRRPPSDERPILTQAAEAGSGGGHRTLVPSTSLTPPAPVRLGMQQRATCLLRRDCLYLYPHRIVPPIAVMQPGVDTPTLRRPRAHLIRMRLNVPAWFPQATPRTVELWWHYRSSCSPGALLPQRW